MMHYMGSKARHAAEIIRIATANRKPGQHWVEPFVGGGNVICRVPASGGPRIGADKNKYMVALLDAVGNRGWMPPERYITEKEYNRIKKSPDDYPPELVAFAATALSFGSTWFGTYARNEKTKNGNPGLYHNAAREAATREAPGLAGVEFRVSDYAELDLPPESIVYCDPPYNNTAGGNASAAGYKGSRTKIAVGESLAKNVWNATKFWKWADWMVDAGHQVFVSEYTGPTPSMYDTTCPRLRDEDRAICTIGKELDAREQLPPDQRPTREEREELFARRRVLDAKEHEERARLAARWQVVWSKRVVSDFSSQRDAGAAKEETELLFHRAP